MSEHSILMFYASLINTSESEWLWKKMFTHFFKVVVHQRMYINNKKKSQARKVIRAKCRSMHVQKGYFSSLGFYKVVWFSMASSRSRCSDTHSGSNRIFRIFGYFGTGIENPFGYF